MRKSSPLPWSVSASHNRIGGHTKSQLDHIVHQHTADQSGYKYLPEPFCPWLFVHLLTFLSVCMWGYACSHVWCTCVFRSKVWYGFTLQSTLFFETGSLIGTWSLLIQIGCLGVCSFFPSTLCRHKKDHFPRVWRLNFVSKLFPQLELSVSWGCCCLKTGVHAPLKWRSLHALPETICKSQE